MLHLFIITLLQQCEVKARAGDVAKQRKQLMKQLGIYEQFATSLSSVIDQADVEIVSSAAPAAPAAATAALSAREQNRARRLAKQAATGVVKNR